MIMKKMQRACLHNERGSLLIIAYCVIALLLGIGAAFMLLATSELRLAERERLSMKSFHIAEAGVDAAFYALDWDLNNDSAYNPWGNGSIYGINVVFEDNVTAEDFFTDVPFQDGQYNVTVTRAQNDASVLLIRSVGQVQDAVTRLEVYIKQVNLSPWEYVIFAGSGMSGKIINGNVDIRGAVLILGEDLDEGAYAVDLGGTAEIVGNNYRTLADYLKAKVPVLPQVFFNNEWVETLNATLRVKKGIVGISGSSAVGEANVTGNGYKETVDGVYVTDGYGGTAGAGHVFSDNGTSEAFDLGEEISFPRLSDPYKGYPTYEAYLKTTGYELTAAEKTKLGNLANQGAFSFGNSKGSVSWDGNGALTVDGILYVDNGTTPLALSSKKTDLVYSGKGSMVFTGDVVVQQNLVTSGDRSFPDNILGIMTKKSLNLGKSAQVDIMGVFYAQDKITIDKQTNVIGTIVSNYFDMGGQVPKIYQVPATAKNLPPGMIGNDRRMCQVLVWRKY